MPLVGDELRPICRGEQAADEGEEERQGQQEGRGRRARHAGRQGRCLLCFVNGSG